MILDGRVEDTQLGAFLMLLRHKEESSEELAGFTEAVRERLQVRPCASTSTGRVTPARSATCPGTCWPPSAWPAMACASSCTAAARIPPTPVQRTVAGGAGDPALPRLAAGRAGPGARPLGVHSARCLDAGAATHDRSAQYLGLRSPIHSLVRLLNPPLNADCILQSIFHPGYQETHREASRLLGDRAIVIKGEGGEVEVNPDVVAHLYGCDQGEAWDEEWPALSTHRHMKPEQLDPVSSGRLGRPRRRRLWPPGGALQHGPGATGPWQESRRSLQGSRTLLGDPKRIDLIDTNSPLFI